MSIDDFIVKVDKYIEYVECYKRTDEQWDSPNVPLPRHAYEQDRSEKSQCLHGISLEMMKWYAAAIDEGKGIDSQAAQEILALLEWPKDALARLKDLYEKWPPAKAVLRREALGRGIAATDKKMLSHLKTKCKILFFAANPNRTPQLALDEESREIDQKIRASAYRDDFELITKWAVRSDDLLQYLNQHRPHIVHFSGHGSPTEEIILLDASRQPKPVSKAALKQLFETLKDNIRVVVLNACYSRPQAEAITEVIDCAVGMNQAIGDQAAITFAASFYRALGFGRSVQEAFDQGKTALMLEGIPEEKTPELLVRKGVDAKDIFIFQ